MMSMAFFKLKEYRADKANQSAKDTSPNNQPAQVCPHHILNDFFYPLRGEFV